MSFSLHLSCLKKKKKTAPHNLTSTVIFSYVSFAVFGKSHSSISISLSLAAYPWTTCGEKKGKKCEDCRHSISVYFWIPKQQYVISYWILDSTVVNCMQFGALNVFHYPICKPSKLNALLSTVPPKAYIFTSNARLIYKCILFADFILL